MLSYTFINSHSQVSDPGSSCFKKSADNNKSIKITQHANFELIQAADEMPANKIETFMSCYAPLKKLRGLC